MPAKNSYRFWVVVLFIIYACPPNAIAGNDNHDQSIEILFQKPSPSALPGETADQRFSGSEKNAMKRIAFRSRKIYPEKRNHIRRNITHLYFYDDKNRLIKEKQTNEATVLYSAKQNYLLISQKNDLLLVDSEGKEIWKKSEPCYPLGVSSRGYSAVVYYADDKPIKYQIMDTKGNVISEFQNPYEKSPIPSGNIIFSESGLNYLKIFTNVNETGMQLCDSSGTTRWENTFKYLTGDTDEILILENYGIVGIGKKLNFPNQIKTYAYFIDWAGRIKWQKEMEIMGNFIIKNNQKEIYICSTFGVVWCFDLETGERKWKYSEPWAPQKIQQKLDLSNMPLFYEMSIQSDNLLLVGKYLRYPADWYKSETIWLSIKDGKNVKRQLYESKITLVQDDKSIYLYDLDQDKLKPLIQVLP